MPRAVALLVSLLVALAAGPARAELWIWTDPKGEERWTDDPSSVPPEQKSTLRRADDPTRPEDEDGGAYTSVDARNEAPPEESPDEKRRREKREEQLRLLEIELVEKERELDELRRAFTKADNEHRRFKYGGRVGAFEKGEGARAEAERLRLRKEGAEKQVEALRGRIELLRDR